MKKLLVISGNGELGLAISKIFYEKGYYLMPSSSKASGCSSTFSIEDFKLGISTYSALIRSGEIIIEYMRGFFNLNFISFSEIKLCWII